MVRKNYWQLCKDWLRQEKSLYLYTCTPEHLLSHAPPLPDDLQIATCDQDMLPQFRAQYADLPKWLDKRVQRGELALFALHERAWVFCEAVVLGPQVYTFHGYPLALNATDALLEAAETRMDWRGRGIAPGTLGPTARELAALGIERIYMAIDVTNTASNRAAEKGGIQRIGTIHARLRFGRWRLARYEPLLPDAVADPYTAASRR
jgi:L-amino acid N-acyltransferase YncA